MRKKRWNKRQQHPCGILLYHYPPVPEAAPRLEALLVRIRRLRANLYPGDWDADPLYQIEQELKSLLHELDNPG